MLARFYNSWDLDRFPLQMQGAELRMERKLSFAFLVYEIVRLHCGSDFTAKLRGRKRIMS